MQCLPRTKIINKYLPEPKIKGKGNKKNEKMKKKHYMEVSSYHARGVES